MLATMAALLLAAGAGEPPAADREAIETQVTAVFGPYKRPASGIAAWDYPIYSAEITALIARWKAVMPQDEPDALSDGDWLCQCQDWNRRRFLLTIITVAMTNRDTAEVDVILDLGTNGTNGSRAGRLVMTREPGGWKIGDMVTDDFPDGLKRALRETIAADEALAAGAAG
jgi:hypothetical protein